MHKAYDSVRSKIYLPKIIHVIGTNGKGTTGRYLAQMLQACGFSTGHYTSPHIMAFNERIWLNGTPVSDEALETAFNELIGFLDMKWQESLSYFEFTTLLAMVAFKSCDYVVLEAGLGGEYDATAVFDNILTVVTPIGLDHADFLGTTPGDVALTKINAVQKQAVTARQSDDVMEVIRKRAREVPFDLYNVDLEAKDLQIVENFAQRAEAEYLVDNFSLALAAVRSVGIRKDLASFRPATLFGRLTQIAPNVTIDVGHNLLAALAIKKHYRKSKVNLVYNTLADKSYHEILQTLQSVIDTVYIIDIDDERALKKEQLIKSLEDLAIPYQDFNAIEPDKNYLVFGSFVVVEAFLRRTDHADG